MKRSTSKSWSNLPADIVNLIAEKVYYCADYADQIRFRTVCKSWQSTSVPLKEINLQPWLFSYNSYKAAGGNPSLSYLYDTTRKLRHTIKTDPQVLGSNIQASKYGWLLFTSYNSSPCSLFFYNPFIAAIIELPALHMWSFDKATFSLPPTSSDCVVFVLSVCYSSEKICISTCKPGQRTWIRYLFDGFYGDLHGLTYLKGDLYCSFCNDVLGAFRVLTKTWKIYPHNRIRPDYVYEYRGLIESHDEGDLLTVYYDYQRSQWHVFRLDWLKMKWLEVDSLDDRALFLGRTSMKVKAVDDANELANTIHDGCWSYFYKRPEGQRLSCPQSYGWILKENPGTSDWIQPPLSRGDSGIRISNLLSITPL